MWANWSLRCDEFFSSIFHWVSSCSLLWRGFWGRAASWCHRSSGASLTLNRLFKTNLNMKVFFCSIFMVRYDQNCVFMANKEGNNCLWVATPNRRSAGCKISVLFFSPGNTLVEQFLVNWESLLPLLPCTQLFELGWFSPLSRDRCCFLFLIIPIKMYSSLTVRVKWDVSMTVTHGGNIRRVQNSVFMATNKQRKET